MIDDTREPFIDVSISDHLYGFAGAACYGRGVTTGDCHPLRSHVALQGQALTPTPT